MVYRLLGLVALAVVLAVAMSCAGTASETQDMKEQRYTPNGVPIAALLYIDAGHQPFHPYDAPGGLGTWRWNMYGAEPPHPWTGFTTTWPEIGWYASQNIETIKWQLEQMQRAGINTVIISWSGWGDDNLDGSLEESLHVQLDITTRKILDYIVDHNLPFRFSFLLEDFPNHTGHGGARNLDDTQRQMVLDYVWGNYFSPTTKYGSFVLMLNEAPVLFSVSVDPDGIPNAWWGNHDFTDERFDLIELAEFSGIEDQLTSVFVYEPPPSAIPGKDGIVTIWPRFTDLILYVSRVRGDEDWVDPFDPDKSNPSELDPLGKEGVYDQAWKRIIEHPRRSEIKLIWIWYWNSYWEVCYIEPDAGIGAYAVGDLYVRKTAHYADLFRGGLPFEHFDGAN